MAVDLVIQGGRVWSSTGFQDVDLYVDDGRVVGVGRMDVQARQIIRADGLYVMPGVVDAHVHIPDPDRTDREDFPSGTAAAASNGTTFILEHHHSLPVKHVSFLREKVAYLRDRSHVDFGLIGAGHPDNLGELHALWDAGVYAFKVFTCHLHGVPAVLNDVMLRLLREVARFDGLCLIHCEDDFITGDNGRRLKAEGRLDGTAVPAWRALEAELTATAATCITARRAGARIIIAHVSHPEVLDVVRAERARGGHILAETCPQYLWLTEAVVAERGPWAKFTPPARSEDARREMWRRVARREIDLVSADHAPTTKEEKRQGESDIWECPFGLPGAETTLSAMLTGMNRGLIDMSTIVALMCEGPAKAYGLFPKKGALRIGSDADIVLVDPQRKRQIQAETIISKAGWSAFEGQEFVGAAVKTLVRGKVVWDDGVFLEGPGYGQYVPRPGSEALADANRP